jgi:hypothetical protein
MRSDDIDWRGGVVTYWSMDEIDLDANLPDQAEAGELREDLAQIEYGPTRLIDVGWYPECSRDGHFRVCVIGAGDGIAIRAEDWSRLLFDAHACDGEALFAILEQAIAFAARRT